jgi:hypothetical protein
MTEDEIIDNNNLIAEFMGNKIVYDGISHHFYYNDNNCMPKVIQTKNLYNSSWNWIMKVVDKIESLKYISIYISKTYLCKKHRVEISYEAPDYQHSQNNKTIFIESESKIECVFFACVEFIVWYNSNKNKIN